MDGSSEGWPRLTAAVVFACAAASVAGACWPGKELRWEGFAAFAWEVSPLLLLSAAVLALVKPRVGFALALVSGLIALWWLVQSERWLGWSSWVVLNQDTA